ncbi:foldase [Paenibacillus antri]|uniref:Foldase n=1 Tax=Paenibacillus antri TaxID=2582848 RepID=A0A5R9FWN7_9BACL|nr:peptidylprolyl isomerase [Paenibacillus antri]TLS48442.1 foldase [Paenibacillus antri]
MNDIVTTKWKIVSLVLLALLIAAALFPFLREQDSDLGPAASVNGVAISKQDVFDALLAADGGQTLSSMIDEELVRQAAEAAGVEVADEDIAEQMDAIKGQFPSEDDFLSTLAMYGMTVEGLEEQMAVEVQLKKLLEPQVTVTDEEIQTYYDENAASLEEPEQVKASHILVATEEEAKELRQRLSGGEDFATLAAEQSLDTGTVDAGGDLGFFEKGVMEEPFETAAFSIEVGQLSEPVETSNGFHIIQVSEKKAAYMPTLEEKKEEIREALVNEALSALSTTWLEEQRTNADVEEYL